jgi:hypothetical protein
LRNLFEPPRYITLPFPLDGPDERAREAALRRLAPEAARGWDWLWYVRYLRAYYPADLAGRWEPLAADPEPEMRCEVVYYLRDHAPQELPRRVDQFRADPSTSVRLALAWSVAATDAERAVWLLIDLLPDGLDHESWDPVLQHFRRHGTRAHLEELERRDARTGAANRGFAAAADYVRDRLWQAGDYTAAEWDSRTYAPEMVRALRGTISDRKLRLFVVACCRSAWHHLTDERSRRAVEVAERFADGAAGPAELRAAHAAAENASGRDDLGAETMAARAVWAAAGPDLDVIAAAEAADLTNLPRARSGPWAEAFTGAEILKDIVGNPFRPAPAPLAAEAWGSETALHLARGIYEARAFDLLPILADALEEAGCADAALLAHCRSGGAHVRGCWALDLVLGKR